MQPRFSPDGAWIAFASDRGGTENLWIADGSIFPTSLGVNPQISVYAHAHLFATELAKEG